MTGRGKFAPKLTFEQRCSYYLAYKLGADIDEIAKSAGVNRSSIKRLVDSNYRSYANVKLEYNKLGREEFRYRHESPEVLRLVALAQAAAQGG